MITPFGKFETTPDGTGDLTGIYSDDFLQLDALLYAISFWLKTGTIDGKVTGTTSLANPTITADHLAGYTLIPDKCILVPVTFTAVATLPQLEIGEDVVGTNSLVAAVTPTLTSTQTQELTLKNPRPMILPAGSLKVKVDTAATGTACTFQIWTKFLAK